MLKALNDIPRKQWIQYVLTVLLTVVIVYFSSAVWYRGIVLSFNAQSDKNIQYQVFYTETTEQDFNEKQSVKKYVIDGFQKVKIGLPIGKIAKLRLAFGSIPERLEISDIQMKGTDHLNLEYNEFVENEIDYSTIQDGKIIIYSYKNNPYITYKKDLNLVRNNRIDWCRLIIITVLALFFVFKLTKYLADERYSKIDVILIAVFFALLFMPMSHISDARRSEKEFRMLAKKPQISIYNENKKSYGEQFNAWFSDHFFGRDELLELHRRVERMNNILLSNITYYNQKTKWIFHKSALGEELADEKKKEIFNALEEINNFAKANGAKFYLFIIPHKTDIYVKSNLIYAIGEHRIYGDYIDYLQKNADFPVIYPLDVLKKASEKDYVFFKRDHHWTEWGAYNGYKLLIKDIEKDFANVPLLTEKDYAISYSHKIRNDWNREFKDNDTIMDMNISDDDEYKYYEIASVGEVSPNVIDIENYKIKEFYNENSPNDLKVILAGTSNNENFLQFLPYSFRELRYLRFNTVKGVKAEDEYKLMKRYKQYILEHKPDILILSIIADNISELGNLSKEN